MRLLLIRHGQTPSNVAGALDTAFPGAELTALGEAQAAAVPAALSEERIVGVYASPLTRTQLTAAPLARDRGLEVQVLDGLQEVGAGDLEMSTEPEAAQAYAACIARWMSGDLDYAMPGGPVGHDVFARYDAAVRTLAERHGSTGTVAAFSHGAVIRLYATLVSGVDPEAATELRIMNTGMAVLEGDPASGWQLVRWQTDPLGGLDLEDLTAHDVTGDSADETLQDE